MSFHYLFLTGWITNMVESMDFLRKPMIKENKVKSALRSGKTIIGSEASRFGVADLMHIFAQAGFDFIFIDMEHTTFNLETVAQMIQVSRLLDITPIVRVPDAEYHLVARVIDVGAQGEYTKTSRRNCQLASISSQWYQGICSDVTPNKL
ncbi:TPA: hypothetical protein EYM26_04415 [Candidatus Poribacteria bacterium]|nr:hypothetical protein [Candidatus Poribacteria bacterium]